MPGRGAACRRIRRSGSAFCYDDVSLDAAWDIVKDWSADERQKLRDDVPRAGFAAKIRDRRMLDLARECCGSRSRTEADASG
jgi:glutamate--cysteine ligase